MVAYLALELLGLFAGEFLAIVLAPLRGIFEPPHGAVVLGVIWILAGWGTLQGWEIASTHSAGILLIVLPIPAALIASLVFRDVRREYRGLPPVRTALPERLPLIWRLASGIGAAFFALLSVALAVGTGSEAWMGVLSCAVGAVWLAYAAVVGRFPSLLRRVLEGD